ncbi:homeotic protein female sterile isoform X2 [Plutella xylostella]|uniref:homeotic protein female sterile isoform X2 n=1 Tax=Plutella xylostella TaxID=51655 RepID=UPI002032C7FA|nr:homeotic protein female sterile isoform X2 [Plutella xylostella]
MRNHISIALLALFSGVQLASSGNWTDTCELEPWDAGPWGAVLEEWATATAGAGAGARRGRILAPPGASYYITDAISDRVGLAPPPPRGYDEWTATLPATPAPKIVNKPSKPYKDQFKPSPVHPAPQQVPQHQQQYPQQHYPPQQQQQYPQQQYPQQQQQQQQQYQPQHQQYPPQQQYPDQYPQQQYPGQARPPTPSAADRVDPSPPPAAPAPARPAAPARKEVSDTDLYLLAAIEKLVYRVDLMEKRLRRAEESLHYLLAGKDKAPEPCVDKFTRVGGACYHFSLEAADWKSANLACRKLRAALVELDSSEEQRLLMAAVHADKKIKELDFWTGGLNPGLLWIWAGSARPVLSNSTGGGNSGGGGNSTQVIHGEGRCLALVWDPPAARHVYRGQDCAFRHRYVCEKTEDKTKLSNEIAKVSRSLRLAGAALGAGAAEAGAGGARRGRELRGDRGAAELD